MKCRSWWFLKTLSRNQIIPIQAPLISTSMRNFNIHSRSDIQVDLAEKLALLQDAVEIRIPPNPTLAKYFSGWFSSSSVLFGWSFMQHYEIQLFNTNILLICQIFSILLNIQHFAKYSRGRPNILIRHGGSMPNIRMSESEKSRFSGTLVQNISTPCAWGDASVPPNPSNSPDTAGFENWIPHQNLIKNKQKPTCSTSTWVIRADTYFSASPYPVRNPDFEPRNIRVVSLLALLLQPTIKSTGERY